MSDSRNRTPTERLAHLNEVAPTRSPTLRPARRPTTASTVTIFSIPRSRKRHEVDPGGRIHLCACGGLVPAGLCPSLWGRRPVWSEGCAGAHPRRRYPPVRCPHNSRRKVCRLRLHANAHTCICPLYTDLVASGARGSPANLGRSEMYRRSLSSTTNPIHIVRGSPIKLVLRATFILDFALLLNPFRQRPGSPWQHHRQHGRSPSERCNQTHKRSNQLHPDHNR